MAVTDSAVGGAAAGGAVAGVPGAVVGGFLGAASGFLEGFFGGGGGDDGRFEFTPEHDLQFLDFFDQSQSQIQSNIGDIQVLTENTQNKLALYEAAVGGSLPPEDLVKGLQVLTADLASSLGGRIQGLIDNGFIDEDSQRELQSLRDERAGLNQLLTSDVASPELAAKQAEDRRELEQQLARGGATPAQRARALRELEISQRGEAFNQNQGLFGSGLQSLAAGRGLFESGQQAKQLGFGQALSGLAGVGGAGQSLFGQRLAGLQTQGQLATAGFQVGSEGINIQQRLRQEGQAGFGMLGQTNLSSETRDLVEAGVVGPGSVFQQTGIARNEADRFKDRVREREQRISRESIGGASGENQYDLSDRRVRQSDYDTLANLRGFGQKFGTGGNPQNLARLLQGVNRRFRRA